jgi:hypothetical protein
VALPYFTVQSSKLDVDVSNLPTLLQLVVDCSGIIGVNQQYEILRKNIEIFSRELVYSIHICHSRLYVSVHPQLVIERFYGFLTYLQEIGLKGKKGKLNNYSSHFWPCALPLTALSGIYEYCIPVLY